MKGANLAVSGDVGRLGVLALGSVSREGLH